MFGNGNRLIASAPNFVCILGNDVISHLVPCLDHVDVAFEGNEVWVRGIDVAIGRNIEQRSISKLSCAFFDLCREEIAVSRDNVEANLWDVSLAWLLCQGKCIPLNWRSESCCRDLSRAKPFLKLSSKK